MPNNDVVCIQDVPNVIGKLQNGKAVALNGSPLGKVNPNGEVID